MLPMKFEYVFRRKSNYLRVIAGNVRDVSENVGDVPTSLGAYLKIHQRSLEDSTK